MSRQNKLAVAALLLCASACVAWPLYIQKFWYGSGPPASTLWAGAPVRMEFYDTVHIVPEFWAFAAMTLSATAWAVIDRRKVAVVTLMLALAGYASLGIGGWRILRSAVKPLPWIRVEHYPAPAFYVAAAAIVLALAVILLSPKSVSPPLGRP